MLGLRDAVPGRRWRWPTLRGMLIETLDVEQARWFLWVPVLFGIGIAAYFASPNEPPMVPAAVALGVAILLFGVWRSGAAALLVGGALLALVAGFAAAKWRSDRVAAPVLERAIGPVTVEGWIELIEPRQQRGERITLLVRRVEGLPPEAWPARVRIRMAQGDGSLRPGDGVRVQVNLSPPAGPALPGGYDFSRSAWFQQLGAVGYARQSATRVMLPAPPWSLAWRAPIERLRQAIGARITAALPGETGAIATALITGERGGISDATNDAFRDSGLFHILSISGLHMTIMAGAVFLVVRFGLSLVPLLALRYPIKKWAATAAALGAFGYLLISGASFPTVRSYVMISIMYLAVLLDRPAVALRNVALAALMILAVYPESLIDVSFQMSYAAVVGIIAVYEMLRGREQARQIIFGGGSLPRTVALLIGGILVTTLIASVTVAPFAAYHFHKSQQYAMLANLVAIPICNLIVMPMALATLVVMPLGLEAWPLVGMKLGIEAMVWCAFTVAALPGAVVRIPAIPTLAFGLMVGGGIWICLWTRRWRWLGLLPVLAGLALAPFRRPPDVLVGRDGGVVAVRGADRLLTALSGRQGLFEIGRWLEHDGDDRRPADVAQGQGFRCDWAGCVAGVRGRRVAIVRHPSALIDDCRNADVVVLAGPGQGMGPQSGVSHLPDNGRGASPCAGSPALVIDPEALARHGAHAIYLDTASTRNSAGPPRSETVADHTGQRPWSDSRTRSSGRRTRTDGAPPHVPALDGAAPSVPPPTLGDDDP